MDLAVLEQKNLVSAWRQAQNHQRKSRKKSGSSVRKSKQEKNDFDLVEFFKTLTTGAAKAILIAACVYGVFSSYRFITSSLHFNINKIKDNLYKNIHNNFNHNKLLHNNNFMKIT